MPDIAFFAMVSAIFVSVPLSTKGMTIKEKILSSTIFLLIALLFGFLCGWKVPTTSYMPHFF